MMHLRPLTKRQSPARAMAIFEGLSTMLGLLQQVLDLFGTDLGTLLKGEAEE